MGLLNTSLQQQVKAPNEPRIVRGRECSKKFVQQGRSPFDARSVLIVREHDKRARTPLAAFFNIPCQKTGRVDEAVRSFQGIQHHARSYSPSVFLRESSNA